MKSKTLREEILAIVSSRAFSYDSSTKAILKAIKDRLPEEEQHYSINSWEAGWDAYRSEVIKMLEGK